MPDRVATPSSARGIRAEPALCRDCQSCVLACALGHEGRCGPGLARLAIVKQPADQACRTRIVLCQHCDDPACLAACPADAIHLDDRGVAVLVEAECVQCGACAEACPHGALFRDGASGRYLKCDLCAGIAQGPLCVAFCPVGALTLIVQPE